MLTMVLCGLWHGANWTFVAWGALAWHLSVWFTGWYAGGAGEYILGHSPETVRADKIC